MQYVLAIETGRITAICAFCAFDENDAFSTSTLDTLGISECTIQVRDCREDDFGCFVCQIGGLNAEDQLPGHVD